jgi:hypothetical protein
VIIFRKEKKPREFFAGLTEKNYGPILQLLLAEKA